MKSSSPESRGAGFYRTGSFYLHWKDIFNSHSNPARFALSDERPDILL